MSDQLYWFLQLYAVLFLNYIQHCTLIALKVQSLLCVDCTLSSSAYDAAKGNRRT